MLFLATADAKGRSDCSYKGGMPGFVKVVDKQTLAFPDYNGNGMFRSLGNILVNPYVGLLFIDFEHPERLRINGIATLRDDDPLLPEYSGAQVIVRVQVRQIFPNGPRYIHQLRLVKHSSYVPRACYVPPVPNWKRWDEFRSVLPRQDGHLDANLSTYVRRLEQCGGVFQWGVGLLRRVKGLLERTILGAIRLIHNPGGSR